MEQDAKYLDEGVTARLHVIWDHDFRVVFWSRWAYRIFGWTEDDVRGKRPVDWTFIQEDDREEVERAIGHFSRGVVGRQVVRWRHLTRDGQPLTCDWYHYARAATVNELHRVESLVRPAAPKI